MTSFSIRDLRAAGQRASRLIRRMHTDSLLRNSTYMMGTTVVNSALGYLYWIVAARTYPAYGLGLAAALISAMTLTSILSSQGIGWTLVQLLPGRAPGRAWSLTANAGLGTGLFTGLLSAVIVVVALPWFSPQFAAVGHSAAYVLVMIAGVLLWTLSSLQDYIFIAERASGNMLVRNSIFAAIKIPLLILPLLLVGAGPMGIFSTWVLSSGLAVAIGLLLTLRLGRGYGPSVRGMFGEVRAMLSSLAGNHFITIGGMAPMYLLPMFVTARLTPTDNAYFYTTWRLGGLFFMVSPAVAASLVAEGSHATHELFRKARSSVLIIGGLLGPVMLIFALGGRYIMTLFGPNYAEHGLSLLMILIVSAIPDAITNVYVSVLRVQKRLRLAAFLNMAMAAITLVVAWMLLPLSGIAGAGWGWLIAQSVGSVLVGVHMLVAWQKRPAASSKPAQVETSTVSLAPVSQTRD